MKILYVLILLDFEQMVTFFKININNFYYYLILTVRMSSQIFIYVGFFSFPPFYYGFFLASCHLSEFRIPTNKQKKNNYCKFPLTSCVRILIIGMVLMEVCTLDKNKMFFFLRFQRKIYTIISIEL